LVRRLLDREVAAGRSEVEAVRAVLSNHEVPADYPLEDEIPPQVKAACVHTERYGTRWSGIIAVPGAAGPGDRPTVRYTDGPPCVTDYVDAGRLWTTAQ
jgi:hypothetical protein